MLSFSWIQSLLFALTQRFEWSFTLAAVDRPILSADFLRHHPLEVSLSRHLLVSVNGEVSLMSSSSHSRGSGWPFAGGRWLHTFFLQLWTVLLAGQSAFQFEKLLLHVLGSQPRWPRILALSLPHQRGPLSVPWCWPCHYHRLYPQANGMVERMHRRRLKTALLSSWLSELPWVLHVLCQIGSPTSLPSKFLSAK